MAIFIANSAKQTDRRTDKLINSVPIIANYYPDFEDTKLPS